MTIYQLKSEYFTFSIFPFMQCNIHNIIHTTNKKQAPAIKNHPKNKDQPSLTELLNTIPFLASNLETS